jgi:hypothetical protein
MPLSSLLRSPPSQKVTSANFLFWKTLVFQPLRGAQVLRLHDGIDTTPAKTLEVEDANKKKTMIPNPAYTVCIARGAMVHGFIFNLLSPEIHAHAVGLETTVEVWTIITNMFTSGSRTKINHVRGALNNTKYTT